MRPHNSVSNDAPAIPVAWFSRGWAVALAMGSIVMLLSGGGILIWEAGQKFGTWQEQQKIKDETAIQVREGLKETQEAQQQMGQQLTDLTIQLKAVATTVDDVSRRLAIMDGSTTHSSGPR